MLSHLLDAIYRQGTWLPCLLRPPPEDTESSCRHFTKASEKLTIIMHLPIQHSFLQASAQGWALLGLRPRDEMALAPGWGKPCLTCSIVWLSTSPNVCCSRLVGVPTRVQRAEERGSPALTHSRVTAFPTFTRTGPSGSTDTVGGPAQRNDTVDACAGLCRARSLSRPLPQ